MRITGGTKKGMQLKTPKGKDIRPTSSLIREAVFNIVGSDIKGVCFFDLCCGTGIMGIEAISRGAKKAVFVDNARESIDIVRQNLKKTGFDFNTLVVEENVLVFLKNFTKYLKDIDRAIIYIDPPYKNEKLYSAIMKYLNKYLPEKNLLIIIEHRINIDVGLENCELWKVKKYGNKRVSMFTKNNFF
ncbi:conserved hypothetical protein [Thermotomaculum hydrothermale]|uniref:Methyltransferase n=1 Tax=Thermotomaculum hydrothermale TaxID=981385 RepID=A0A7R6PER1_9BACT|nr:16S rRNA (guanine(966)-N(2))-methyltransferase RsmD [Thermotomaculum hydrothermale]BBB32343.1 conserved hypothetical protein [Thermotomaculum hydrothermale]